MHSSYAVHEYSEVFKSIIMAYEPRVCVELGVLEGYSAIAIASALRENAKKGSSGIRLQAYDLFEDYPHRHARQELVQQNIDKVGLSEWIKLNKADAFKVHMNYEKHSVDFLHVDLSNTGAIVSHIMQNWDERMVLGGLICFEGGTRERDEVDWMIKYKADPIKHELETNPIIEQNYVFATYMQFPGMTCLLKKR
jgi:predicted O-methyltransferase YrrM